MSIRNIKVMQNQKKKKIKKLVTQKKKHLIFVPIFINIYTVHKICFEIPFRLLTF